MSKANSRDVPAAAIQRSQLRPVRDDLVFFGVRRRGGRGRRPLRRGRQRVPYPESRSRVCALRAGFGGPGTCEPRCYRTRARSSRRRAAERSRSSAAPFELPQQRAQLIARVQLAQRGVVGRCWRELPRVSGNSQSVRMVASLRDSSSVCSPARRFSPTLPLISRHVLDELVERAVLVQPLRGGLRPDLLDARNVVGAVADEREVVDDLFRDRRRTWPSRRRDRAPSCSSY